jgi:hypothetical protein
VSGRLLEGIRGRQSGEPSTEEDATEWPSNGNEKGQGLEFR